MKRQYAKRCEYCEEVIGPSRWCEACKKTVKGYTNDNFDKMPPPKKNKKACIELLKSMAALARLKQAKKERKPRVKRLFEITCTVCLRVVEVNGWMKRSRYPTCDRPECKLEHRRMVNNMNKRDKTEQGNKRKYTGGTRR